MTKVRFCTADFERSHFRKPSRTAVGTWAFRFDRQSDDWFAPMGTFAEAKRAAAVEAASRNASVARVQP